MTDNERIILGIDPGTNVMGYGVLKAVGNKAQLMALGVIDLRKMHDPYIRLGKIFERITGIIDEYLSNSRIYARFVAHSVAKNDNKRHLMRQLHP